MSRGWIEEDWPENGRLPWNDVRFLRQLWDATHERFRAWLIFIGEGDWDGTRPASSVVTRRLFSPLGLQSASDFPAGWEWVALRTFDEVFADADPSRTDLTEVVRLGQSGFSNPFGAEPELIGDRGWHLHPWALYVVVAALGRYFTTFEAATGSYLVSLSTGVVSRREDGFSELSGPPDAGFQDPGDDVEVVFFHPTLVALQLEIPDNGLTIGLRSEGYGFQEAEEDLPREILGLGDSLSLSLDYRWIPARFFTQAEFDAARDSLVRPVAAFSLASLGGADDGASGRNPATPDQPEDRVAGAWVPAFPGQPMTMVAEQANPYGLPKRQDFAGEVFSRRTVLAAEMFREMRAILDSCEVSYGNIFGDLGDRTPFVGQNHVNEVTGETERVGAGTSEERFYDSAGQIQNTRSDTFDTQTAEFAFNDADEDFRNRTWIRNAAWVTFDDQNSGSQSRIEREHTFSSDAVFGFQAAASETELQPVRHFYRRDFTVEAETGQSAANRQVVVTEDSGYYPWLTWGPGDEGSRVEVVAGGTPPALPTLPTSNLFRFTARESTVTGFLDWRQTFTYGI